MIKKVLTIYLIFISLNVWSWGATGHRTVGEIAEQYLTKKAAKNISKVLNGRSLAVVSTWMDDVKSDSTYDYMATWHWVTIPDGETYETAEQEESGNVIETIERLTAELTKGELSGQKEANAIKILTHLIGDIHQPLHVGTGEDMGGNQVRLKWFWENSNLHRVWDSGMIDSQKYSYTELADAVNHVTEEEIEKWQSASVKDWAYESMALRDQVYDLPEDMNLRYEYRYKNWETVEKRLLMAGVRLAGVLNKIYG